MANPFSHEQRFSVWLVDNATGKIVQQRATSHSAWMTMTTLLAGENFANFAGGFMQVAATGPDYWEPDFSGGLSVYASLNKLVLGVRYWGTTEGVLTIFTYDDRETPVTFLDSSIYGIQEVAVQAKTINGTSPGVGAASTIDLTKLGVYMTKVIKS